MEVIKKISDLGTYDIRIQENEDKHLDIVFGGNGDIYWIYDNYEVSLLEEDPMYDSFIISKNNYNIYRIFDELYNDLINGKIYYPDKIPDFYLKFYPNAQVEEIKRCNDLNVAIKNSSRYKKLVNNNIITWYSDEEPEKTAEIVRISKKDDYFLLEFIRQSKIDDMGCKRFPGWYTIRFRLSGSTYTPCDIVFWRHFNNFQTCDFGEDYYQGKDKDSSHYDRKLKR